MDKQKALDNLKNFDESVESKFPIIIKEIEEDVYNMIMEETKYGNISIIYYPNRVRIVKDFQLQLVKGAVIVAVEFKILKEILKKLETHNYSATLEGEINPRLKIEL